MTKDPIDTAALRRELAELKERPDVKRYHHIRARLAGASGTGEAKAKAMKARWKRVARKAK